ncbi:tyrosine-type recombinase/integrase [Umezawaea sp. Da 62-37]|uniref:tyrosine-type recombinase/integrase n=1 Tax=Umezawaea sp. Da 62-37 TaxID=3075927 RepID=UPI0028F70AA1|nr:tyrosine-type recombinase/integrase [Umezawaea sp. Da 62-37]WNV87636.1 tyrosine-type recombinase/integrase [Umezawaea sp. Da 62-37]
MRLASVSARHPLRVLDGTRCRCQHCRGAYADYRARRRVDGKDRPAKAGRLDTDGHVSRRWFRDTIWKPALTATGITRRVRIHDLRHAHASWLLAGGADVQTVQERLGHASLRAAERYLHTLPESDQNALHAFTRIRDGRSTMTCRPSVRVARAPAGRTRVLWRRASWL